uniref:Secreted protein n=1 Tax=Mesocestoides corti TaxID=53468 RepID=A0A5K3FV66_MESCO
ACLCISAALAEHPDGSIIASDSDRYILQPENKYALRNCFICCTKSIALTNCSALCRRRGGVSPVTSCILINELWKNSSSETAIKALIGHQWISATVFSCDFDTSHDFQALLC